MSDSLSVRVWSKTVPSRSHPERDEDLGWSATNHQAHAVVDGMGGSRRVVAGREIGGEHAARTIGEVLAARLEGLPPTVPVETARDLLAAAVQEAGARIYRDLNESGQIPAGEIPTGKTAEDVMVAAVMTAAVICEGGRRAVISQNGDTRGYLFSGGDLILLTEDQDAVQADQNQGILTPDQAATVQEALDTFDGHDLGKLGALARRYFVQRNLVFGQIGDQPAPAPPALSVIQLRPHDVLLLCSDGVYGNLTTAEITDALSLLDPAAGLVDRADERSGGRTLPNPQDLSQPYNYRAHQDDITAIVVRVDW